MLQLDHVTVRLGETLAVDDVSLALDTGDVLAVLGPSGSGKSTLLRAIAGLEQPTAGRISWDGHDLAGVPVHKRGFALMFQDGQLFGHQSVARNIGYPLRLRHVARDEIQRRVTELLDLVGLSGKADRDPDSLSGGERQRVALARALAVEPRLLLLDEPLSALDRGLREELAGQLRQILSPVGTTAILVTHDQEEAFAVADRMAVMREGRVVQSGSVADVWAHPVDAWTALFLGYACVIDSAAARQLGSTQPGGLAMRRSALRVDPSGSLTAQVLAATIGPEQIRLDVHLAGVGTLAAVADPGIEVPVGSDVRLRLDPSRVAAVPE